jgi:26S proteasome regulatory subunit N7
LERRYSLYLVETVPSVAHPLNIQEKAIEAQQLALEKTAGLGSRIDIVLTLVRIGFFFGDNHLLSIRQFKPASALLIDALSTFTATELLSYNDFVSLTVISGTLTLNRVDLKKKVRVLTSFH